MRERERERVSGEKEWFRKREGTGDRRRRKIEERERQDGRRGKNRERGGGRMERKNITVEIPQVVFLGQDEENSIVSVSATWMDLLYRREKEGDMW